MHTLKEETRIISIAERGHEAHIALNPEDHPEDHPESNATTKFRVETNVGVDVVGTSSSVFASLNLTEEVKAPKYIYQSFIKQSKRAEIRLFSVRSTWLAELAEDEDGLQAVVDHSCMVKVTYGKLITKEGSKNVSIPFELNIRRSMGEGITYGSTYQGHVTLNTSTKYRVTGIKLGEPTKDTAEGILAKVPEKLLNAYTKNANHSVKLKSFREDKMTHYKAMSVMKLIKNQIAIRLNAACKC